MKSNNLEAIDVFLRDVKMGHIPSNISNIKEKETLLLIERLIHLESNASRLTQFDFDGIHSYQHNYPEMFMKNILLDQKKNHSLSIYPFGWFGNYEDERLKEHVITNDFELSCYTNTPFVISILELPTIPLLQFNTISGYVRFMLKLYTTDDINIQSMLNQNHSIDQEAIYFKLAVENLSSEGDFLLVEFLMYRALSILMLQNQNLKSYLAKTKGQLLTSRLFFPNNLIVNLGENFYGNLLMKYRSTIG